MNVKGRSNGAVRIYLSLAEAVELETALYDIHPEDISKVERTLQQHITRYLDRSYRFFNGKRRRPIEER